MMDIKGYIVTVICVCVSSSIVSLLSPEGESGIGRQVRLAAGIVTALAVIAPLVGIVESIGELDLSDVITDGDEKIEEYQSIFDSQLSVYETESIKDGIGEILEKRFGIDPSECEIGVSIEEKDGKRQLKRVFITLYGSAIWSDSGAIEEYLYGLLGCEIVTAIG